jgi:cobalamin biosynthesis protein CobT
LLEAIELAYSRLESILKDPKPEEGDKGDKSDKGAEEGQEGDKGQDGDGEDGEGQDGAEDGEEGADEDGQDGEGQDGAEDGEEGADEDGQDGEGEDGDEDGEGASGGASSDSIGNKPMTDREIQEAIDKWKEQNKNTEDESEPKEVPLHELKTRSPMRDSKFTNDGKKLPSIGTKVSECPLRQEDKDQAAKIGKVKSVVWQSLTEFVDGAPIDLAEYQKWTRSHKRQIDIIAENIHIPPTAENQEEYGRRSGDIDEGSLWTIGAGLSDGRLFMRNNVINKANKLIVILLDMSGSMGGLKIQEASQVVLLLTEAMKALAIPGLDFVVYGHTGDNHGQGSIDMVRILDSRTDETARLAVGLRSCNLNNNYDGFAFQAAINEAELCYPDADDRNLIVISDGEPAGYAYGYMHGVGIAHTASVVQRNRGRGWKIHGIGICSAFPQSTGDNLYGKNNCVILDDTMGSVRILARHIKKICE